MLSVVFLVLLGVIAVSGQVNVVPANGCCCGDYVAFPHNNNKVWYMFIDCPKNWREAENICRTRMRVNGRSVQGHLASVESAAENGWLRFMFDMRYGAKVGIWSGGTRRNPNGCANSWKWSDGKPFSYTNWATNQPSCSWPPNENCIHWIDNNRWNDAECTNRFRGICKYVPRPGPVVPFFDIAVGGSDDEEPEMDFGGS